ncbi:hypothetical protein ACIHFE_27210 [Streptomyces sp. NPDC052396]|uniref:hypothetical protein n=1 Tax=Streptomyces sp. NPDC052396 TaxID=3365689 RepID=UPI0037CF037B
MGRCGRPLGGLKGKNRQANELAGFLRDLTAGVTTRELAQRYNTGRTIWSDYRSGIRLIPLPRLEQIVDDRFFGDLPGHAVFKATARHLYAEAVIARKASRLNAGDQGGTTGPEVGGAGE